MANDSGRDSKFLGLTKMQFLIAAMCFFAFTTLMSLGVLALNVSANNSRASTAAAEVVIAKKTALDIKTAVCGMKDNAREQIRATTTFLIDHPGAEPIPGITRKELTDGLARQRAFLDTMQSLDCD